MNTKKLRFTASIVKEKLILNTTKIQFKMLFIFLLMMAMPAMACGFDVSGPATLDITINISEKNINRIIRNSVVDQDEDNLFDDITRIDMQQGLIRMHGTYENADGMIVEGSADLMIGVQDGLLNAEIIAVDIAGLDVDHPRVTHINDLLAEEFAEEASSNDEIEFVSVDITTNSMEIIVRVLVD